MRERKLEERDVQVILWMYRQGVQQARIAERYGISKSHLCWLIKGKSWGRVGVAPDSVITESERQFVAAAKRDEVRRVKLDAAKVQRIRNLRQMGLTHAALSRKFGVTPATVRRAVNGESWSTVQ